MMMDYYRTKPPTYKSYKAEKFEKGVSRAKALRQSIMDSSLKEEDKKKLIEKMIIELKNNFFKATDTK